ncbi:hypothetical protein [Viridibacillus arvi]
MCSLEKYRLKDIEMLKVLIESGIPIKDVAEKVGMQFEKGNI